MMSLFSSFDNYFFKFAWASFFIILINLYMVIFKFSMKNLFFKMINMILTKFFYSLKMDHNKFSSIMFISIFFLGLTMNFISVFPYNFAKTSQLAVVMFLGLTIWTSVSIFSGFNSMKNFMTHLIPEGCPLSLIMFIFMIELISLFIRPITLTVRLVANILAGHLLLILASKLVLMNSALIPSFLSYLILNILELAVAGIQAYIFTTMLVLYYSEF